jgi:catechol 2,3-dioxygenase-like lactoylglutathione lyase family enzyme
LKAAERGEIAMRMSHTRLLVSKYRECFFFYRDVMGFPVEWGDESGTYADFDAGRVLVALVGYWSTAALWSKWAG